MPGGLLNLISYGNQNVILNGNPSKSFFKCAYSKYTNFGLQKFRLDFDGQRHLRMNETSTFKFKVPRYADLLMDTYLVVRLPTIWSPILPPTDSNNGDPYWDINSIWRPYEFKWIQNLGTQMIERVKFTIGGVTIQDYTGQYLYNLVERDFNNVKKDLYYKMTGNVSELNDPANAFQRNGYYPNVYPTNLNSYSTLGPEPSIRERKLYIPLNIWFTMASKMALPLVSLQYQELQIEIDIRPVSELFVVRDVETLVLPSANNAILHPGWDNIPNGSATVGKHIKPNFNNTTFQFYRFLQPPPWNLDTYTLTEQSWTDKRTNWAADVHIIATYAFLSDDEVRTFASREQNYLIKESYTTKFNNVVGSSRIDLDSFGMVSSWMWFFQRNDVNIRNEWSNYTNWDYKDIQPIPLLDPSGVFDIVDGLGTPNTPSISVDSYNINPANNPIGLNTDYKITGNFSPDNTKNIMQTWGLLLDGKYRENLQDVGVLDYIEKYIRTSGNGPDGLYCYNFCLHTNPFDFQPSGAINVSKFNDIQFEITTFYPPLDPSAQVLTICDASGNIIGVNKPSWRIYDYTYDLTVLEERYNILTFINGNAGLAYAR